MSNLKSKEFRIGNLLQDQLGNLLKVTDLNDGIQGITYKAIDRRSKTHPDGRKAHEIQLTEYWTDMFGFSNYNNEISNCDLWHNCDFGDFNITFEGDHFLFMDTKIETVHHLQNLYFEVKRKELTLKNKE